MKKLISVILSAFFCLNLYAQTDNSQTEHSTAIAEDGTVVILYSDGTWVIKKTPTPDAVTFRSIQWGNSKDVVQTLEKNSLSYIGDEYVSYKGSIANLPCSIFYIFANDLLVRGRYYFEQEHTNNNDFINDFNALGELLSEKYGSPDLDDQVWKSEVYKEMPSFWGMAIAMGNLSYHKIWYTENTTIHLQLYGDNFKVKCVIDYISTAYGHLEDEIKSEAAKEQL